MGRRVEMRPKTPPVDSLIEGQNCVSADFYCRVSTCK